MLFLSHILRMTDHIGILEHCKGITPDPLEGYTTDDNARALQLMLRLQQSHQDAEILLPVYFRFLRDAAAKNGFHNERSARGEWEDTAGVGDWFGRAMLALADVAVLGPEEFRLPAITIFDEKIPLIKTVVSIHTIALLLEALCQRLQITIRQKYAILPTHHVSALIDDLAGKLVDAYKIHTQSSWQWFDTILTYENAKLPEALLLAFKMTGKKEYREISLTALDFLVSQTFDEKKGMFSFIGNNGWFPRGGQKAVFGQQPVDAAAAVEACCTAYRVTDDTAYRMLAQKAFAWYEGENIYGASLLDKKTGGVLDGLEEYCVSLNEGAESVITYGLAWCAFKEMEKNFPS